MDLITVLPNLAIGTVAILALGFITVKFIEHLRAIHQEHKAQLDEQHRLFLTELKERESAIRQIEREVRTNISDQLAKNTHILDRALIYLEK